MPAIYRKIFFVSPLTPNSLTLGVFRVEKMLANEIIKVLPQGLELILTNGGQILFSTHHNLQSQISNDAWTADIPIDWHLTVNPIPEYLSAHRSLLVWLVLAVGLALAGLLQAFLLAMTGRATLVQRQLRNKQKCRPNRSGSCF